MTQTALSPRLQRRQEEISALLPDENPDYFRGMLNGLRVAMKMMYPDAEKFVGEEPNATGLVLTYRAVESKIQ